MEHFFYTIPGLKESKKEREIKPNDDGCKLRRIRGFFEAFGFV